MVVGAAVAVAVGVAAAAAPGLSQGLGGEAIVMWEEACDPAVEVPPPEKVTSDRPRVAICRDQRRRGRFLW